MDNVEYKYVDESGVVYTGREASDRLSQGSDEKYITSEGILTVDRQRWEAAQRYELSEWLVRASFANDDRNYFHKSTFEDYASLDFKDSIESFVELGCGPFTNARVILQKFPNVKDITLVDPLADQYMSNHNNCTYKDSRLEGKSVKVISKPIEDLEQDKKYDMVVMINVLEHCFDIPAILEKVNNILSENGCFIYADVQFDKEVVDRLAKTKYNAGHPIRITKEYMNNYLETNYTTLFSKVIPEEVAGETCEEIYFIGRKRNSNG